MAAVSRDSRKVMKKTEPVSGGTFKAGFIPTGEREEAFHLVVWMWRYGGKVSSPALRVTASSTTFLNAHGGPIRAKISKRPGD